VIRERFKLHRQVKVFTAEGRMSLYVLTASPLLTALLLWFVNRDYVRPLLTDPFGQKMTLFGLGLLAAGYEVIRRMVNLKV
jgi:tight adherence protein B